MITVTIKKIIIIFEHKTFLEAFLLRFIVRKLLSQKFSLNNLNLYCRLWAFFKIGACIYPYRRICKIKAIALFTNSMSAIDLHLFHSFSSQPAKYIILAKAFLNSVNFMGHIFVFVFLD